MCLIVFTSKILALNELIVRVPDIYVSYPGYIDKSTIVIEPHGGYAEQSLYLEYSDHYQFNEGQKVEIIHRFELPQGAVINDLWLWIGDSVMQAILLDTWTARGIYDSIVSMKRDPAFLSKKGNQYELHIYPLTPGSYRKVKINYITPTRWIGKQAFVELPLQMLKSNNNTLKPLEVLYRVKEDIWGIPLIKEYPGQIFSDLTDTMGYHYKYTSLNDISNLSSLKLEFNIDLPGGTFFKSNENDSLYSYFQLSLLLKDIFNLIPDSSSKKALIGLDLSGAFNKNYSTLIPQLKTFLKSALKREDYLNLIVSGAGRINKISNQWVAADPVAIDELINSFYTSEFADSVSLNEKPRLIYADSHAATCWNFMGADSFATVSTFGRLYIAADYFNQADVIASYAQGFEDIPSEFELPKILTALDSFFLNSGRFLTYYDFNRDEYGEKVATHYIHGLKTKSQVHDNVTLYRNNEGNIGLDFLESIDHAGTYFLQYNDPDVKIELRNAAGDPAVISKQLGNGGLIVVSGIWSFNDDDPLRKLLAIPLLGLNNYQNSYAMLPLLLEKMKNEYLQDPFDKAIVLSNSDSLILENPADNWAQNYISQFGFSKPVFSSINLLDGVFPSITVNGTPYYGSGYLLKKISSLTGGLHFETHLNDWDYISSLLSPYSLPSMEQFSIEKWGDEDTNKIIEFRQIKQEPQDINSPLFFIGSTNAADLRFKITSKFAGIDSTKERTLSFPVSFDTTNKSKIIYSMLGFEKLKELFAYSVFDTAQIVATALEYHLLCDYTALIALEPNDTLHFMKDPLDEPALGFIDGEAENDTLEVSVYPNPFNSQTKILVLVPSLSKVNIYIYNILGQLVKTITEGEEIAGRKSYLWNGVDSHNSAVSSGIYLLRVELKDIASGRESYFAHKLLLIK
jgi:hypothetical protein